MLDDQGLLLSGPVTLAELTTVLIRLAELRGVEGYVRVRVVAVPDSTETWQLFAGRLDVLEEGAWPEELLEIGPVRLVTCSAPVSAIRDQNCLQSLLLSWLGRLGQEMTDVSVQDSIHVDRLPSAKAGSPPSWQCDLFCARRGNSSSIHLDGPFLHEPLGLLARSVGELAAQWLDLPSIREHRSATSRITAMLPDPRAALEHVGATADAIHLTIRQRQAETPLRVMTFLRDATGQTQRALTMCLEDEVRIAVPETLRAIELFLVNASGVCLDSFYEDEHRCSRLERVLYAVTTSAQDDLQLALQRGEGDQVEFKEWIPLDRGRAKSLELFKTVCAFANADGGSLYIGVTTDLQFRSIDTQVRQACGRPADPIEEQRKRYSNELLRYVREGIAPNVQAEADWVSLAGHHVLRIAVAQSLTRDHFVLEDRTSYIRRGASSAKASAADLGSSIGGILGSLSPRRRRLGM